MANHGPFTMDDLIPADRPQKDLELQIREKREQRLMLKEQRLKETNQRLERQRQDEAKKEKRRRSQIDQATQREREEASRKLRERGEEAMTILEIQLALDAAAEVSGYNVNPIQREFMVAFMMAMKKSKVL